MKFDDKSMVGIGADGNVITCAKLLSPADCGFVNGAAVCGKCGAAPVRVKIAPMESTEEDDMKDKAYETGHTETPVPAAKKKLKPRELVIPDAAEPEGEVLDEDIDGSEEELDEEGNPILKKTDEEELDEEGNPVVKEAEEELDEEGNPVAKDEELDIDDDDDDDDDDEEELAEKGSNWRIPPKKSSKKKKIAVDEYGDPVGEDIDDDVEEKSDESGMDVFRQLRLESLGLSSDEFGSDGFICAIERKSLLGGASVCDDCPGGCMAEKGMPSLLHVEGLAEDMFGGTVLDSGYSADADMFVVDVQVKDGKAVEIFVDGTSGEVMGWHRLDSGIFEQKSAIDEVQLISFNEAAEIAIKSIDGHVVAVEPDTFEGLDAYAVEIDAFDGKSYDVFVSLDGEVLGYDKYEQDEAEEIEAEAAEIALKRAFSDENRTQMAAEGSAMPDGSFPIKSQEDLRNAIQSVGRAKDKTAARNHIMKRATDLDMANLIPATWVAGVEEKSAPVIDTDGDFLKQLVEFQLLEIDNNS